MKKYLLPLLILLAAPAFAAQQEITAVPASPANPSIGSLKTAINLRLADIDENFDEIYPIIEAGPVYVNASAPADTKVVWIDTDQDNAIKVHVGGVWTVVGSGGEGSYTLPTADADTLGGIKVGARLTITDGVLSADVQAGGESTTVGDGTTGPYLDGTVDGGTLIKLSAPSGGNGTWTSLQGGNPTANRNWRLPIDAPPAAGTTRLINVDENTQMGLVDPATFLTPTGSADLLTVTDTGTHFTTDTVAAALQELGSELAGVTEITLDASLTETGGVLSVTNPVTDYDTDGDGDFTDEAWFPVGTGYTDLTQYLTQTAWRLFYSDGSGDVTELALGASGTVLHSNGATAAPTWETPSGGTGGYLATPPTYSDEACTPGQYALSETYRWDCVATGNWNRTSLTDWSNPAPVPPTLTSATVGSLGLYADLLFSETVEAGTGGSGGWSMDCATTGAISMTYSSGDTTNTLAYSLSTPPIQDETCTVSYAQPTDGIEAVDDGTDLATIPSAAVTNNSTQTPASACMSGTYIIAWDGSHTSGATYACDSLGNAVAGTTNGSPDISSTYGEGAGDVALMANAVNEYIKFTDAGGAIVDLNGAQTVWVRVYISATPTGYSRVFGAVANATNLTNIQVTAAGLVEGTLRTESSAPKVLAPAALTPGTWTDVGYSWDKAGLDHTVNIGGTWDDDLDELSAAASIDVANIYIGSEGSFSMGAGEDLRVTKIAVVNGYKAAKPW